MNKLLTLWNCINKAFNDFSYSIGAMVVWISLLKVVPYINLEFDLNVFGNLYAVMGMIIGFVILTVYRYVKSK